MVDHIHEFLVLITLVLIRCALNRNMIEINGIIIFLNALINNVTNMFSSSICQQCSRQQGFSSQNLFLQVASFDCTLCPDKELLQVNYTLLSFVQTICTIICMHH